MKAFADDKFDVAKWLILSMFGRVVKLVGKGENAGYQHFLLFPQVLKRVTVFLCVCKMDLKKIFLGER